MPCRRSSSVGWGLILLTASVQAHDPGVRLPDLRVVGEAPATPSLSTEGDALPARVDVIDRERIESMAVDNILDVFRGTAGVTVRNLRQGDIGDDFGLRGFSGGHGVDVAIVVDGVPVNQVNGRTHGLSDLNWLTPQMIERVELIKGPFSARYGNFGLGGVVNITTRDGVEAPRLDLTAGRFGHAQGVLSLGDGAPFLVLEGYNSDGYRDNAFSRRYGLFGKYGIDFGEDHQLSLRLQGSDRDFGATGYLAVDDVASGARDRREATNNTDGGEVAQYTLSARYTRPLGTDTHLHATAFAGHDRRSRFADFSGTSQSVTDTDIDTLGWRADVERRTARMVLTLGTDGRRDAGSRIAERTDGQRNRGARTSDRDFTVLESNLFAEWQWQALDTVKSVVGLRYDRFDTEVHNRLFSSSGENVGTLLSPKLGLTWSPTATLDVYANRGQGLRSPSQVELSPDVAEARFNDLDPFRVRSTDLGAEWRFAGAGLLRLNVYETATASELVNIGNGVFVNAGATERDGYEAELRWRAAAYETYASVAGVHARIVDAAADRVSGVPADTQTLGFTLRRARLTLDTFVQRYGTTPLNAAGTQTRPAIVNLGTRLSGRHSERLGWFAQLYWYPDDLASETQFVIGGRNSFDPRPDLDAQVGLQYRL